MQLLFRGAADMAIQSDLDKLLTRRNDADDDARRVLVMRHAMDAMAIVVVVRLESKQFSPC